jgi:peptidyl-tRNA hydrolase, PTH2 family
MKQVIVVRESLNLPRGKLAAQVAHAAVGALLRAAPAAQRAWLEAGMPKIVLSVAGEEALLDLQQRAEAAGLPVCLVQDAGRTVVPAGTTTALGIGPAPAADIDPLTGALPLLL